MKKEMRKIVAIVTGGRSGIGRAVAEELAAQGVTVYVPGRTPFAAEGIRFIQADVSSEQEVRCAVQAVMEKEGQIDLLVNGAGYGLLSAVELTPVEEARRQLDVNFFGTVMMTAAVLPVMRKQNKGRIVNISSLAAAAPLPFQAYYSVSKAAVDTYTDALRNEVKPYGIDCCCVLPGDTRTGFTAARRTIQDGSGTYGKRVAASLEKQSRFEQEGIDPKISGKRIARICLTGKIRGIYLLDPLSYLEWLLLKFLPHDASRAILGLLYGEWDKNR